MKNIGKMIEKGEKQLLSLSIRGNTRGRAMSVSNDSPPTGASKTPTIMTVHGWKMTGQRNKPLACVNLPSRKQQTDTGQDITGLQANTTKTGTWQTSEKILKCVVYAQGNQPLFEGNNSTKG